MASHGAVMPDGTTPQTNLNMKKLTVSLLPILIAIFLSLPAYADETIRTVLPSFFMAHIQWKFNKSPKKH